MEVKYTFLKTYIPSVVQLQIVRHLTPVKADLHFSLQLALYMFVGHSEKGTMKADVCSIKTQSSNTKMFCLECKIYFLSSVNKEAPKCKVFLKYILNVGTV